jgi:TonB family protein
MTDTTNRDKNYSFPGGMKAWKKYAAKKAHFPPGWEIKNTNQVTVVVHGVIDEEGNVTEVEASLPFHPDFDKTAISLIQKSKWIPAVSHNRKVKQGFTLPVTFSQE